MNKYAQNLVYLLDDEKYIMSIYNNFYHQRFEKALENIWQGIDMKIGSNLYKRPDSLSQKDILDLQKMGYIRYDGSGYIEITSSGKDVLKKAILKDETSPLDLLAVKRKKQSFAVSENININDISGKKIKKLF